MDIEAMHCSLVSTIPGSGCQLLWGEKLKCQTGPEIPESLGVRPWVNTVLFGAAFTALQEHIKSHYTHKNDHLLVNRQEVAFAIFIAHLTQGVILVASFRLIQNPAPPVANQKCTDFWRVGRNAMRWAIGSIQHNFYTCIGHERYKCNDFCTFNSCVHEGISTGTSHDEGVRQIAPIEIPSSAPLLKVQKPCPTLHLFTWCTKTVQIIPFVGRYSFCFNL